MYDRAWTVYRFRFLHYNPKCYCCKENASVVDHIIAHKGKESLFKDTQNHMPLCRECHNVVTALFDRHEVQKLDDKIKWINKARIENKISNKIRVLPSYSKRKG